MGHIFIRTNDTIAFCKPHLLVIPDTELEHLDILERFHDDILIEKITPNLPDTKTSHRIARDTQVAGKRLMPNHKDMFHLIRTNLTARSYKDLMRTVRAWY